jgi:2-hydroxychromene-2-carboxylate isomerase
VPRHFSLTYDYLCPFARIANETVVEALREGAPWEITFVPFSLAEVHIEEGEPSVWDRSPDAAGVRGVRALAWSLAVRDGFPDAFVDFHIGLFSARHDRAADVDADETLYEVAAAAGLDSAAVAAVVAGGGPLATLAKEHTEAFERWSVFGVPTFIAGDEAVFVRFMVRHQVEDVGRVLDMLSWTNLNEFKRTTIPR